MDLRELMGQPGVLPQDPGRNKVLVVDDELAHRMLVVRILRKVGYECQPASSTQEAREALRGSAFGLVVTDMRMWAEDGIELVRHIADRYPNTHSLVVTGLAVEDLKERMRQAGASAVLQKPLDRDNFTQVVQETMDKRDEDFARRRHQSG